MPSTPIRIDDLRVPKRTALLEETLAQVGNVPLRLSVEDILSEARARTGLSDFGADDFKARLELWLQSIAEDRALNGLGRLGLFNDCKRLAANRLRIEDLLKRHPEILEIKLERPIIIAGLPRSGTTHLVNLISADPRLRSLPLWESMEPVPSSADEAVIKAGKPDPRYVRAKDAWGHFEAMLPLMPAMHEMAPEHTHEEIELQQIDFASYNLEWLCRPHRWRDYYYEHDQTPHYLYSRKVLQVLTYFRGPRRWILKSPQHMEQLGPLKAAFPDATLVITHRDPISVIQSAITMLAYGDRLRRTKIDTEALAIYWIERIEHLLRACVRDRALWTGRQAMDVFFHRYMANEEKTLEDIYALAGLPLDEEAQRALKAYLDANPRGKHGRVIYDLKGDFGINIGALYDRFDFYFKHFPIEREH